VIKLNNGQAAMPEVQPPVVWPGTWDRMITWREKVYPQAAAPLAQLPGI